jgi:hypothetical protein
MAVGMKCIEDPMAGHPSSVCTPWFRFPRGRANDFQPASIFCVMLILKMSLFTLVAIIHTHPTPSGQGLCGATCGAAITDATLQRTDVKLPCDNGLDGVIAFLGACMKSQVGSDPPPSLMSWILISPDFHTWT